MVIALALVCLAVFLFLTTLRKKRENFSLKEEKYVGMFCHFKDKSIADQLLDESHIQ